MKLYLVERTDDIGYDEFDSAVVAAPDESAALVAGSFMGDTRRMTVKLVGVADPSIPGGQVLASFNAG